MNQNDKPQSKRSWIIIGTIGCATILLGILLCIAVSVFTPGKSYSIATEQLTPKPTPEPLPMLVLHPGQQIGDSIISPANIDQLHVTGFCGKGQNTNAVFSPNNDKLIVSTTNGLFIQDLLAPKNSTFILTGENTDKLAFSPDGTILASWSSRKQWVNLWRTSDWKLQQTIVDPSENNPVGISGLAFSPDGKLMATGSSEGLIRLWNIPDGTLMRSFTHPDTSFNNLKFSADGKLLLAALGNQVDIRRISDGELLDTVDIKDEHVRDMAITPDGSSLLLGTLAINNGAATAYSVFQWNFSDRSLEQVLHQSNSGVKGLVFSPDTSIAAIFTSVNVNESKIDLLTIPDGRHIGGFEETPPIEGISFSNDGQLLALNAYRRIYVANISGGTLQLVHSDFYDIEDLSFSPDGSTLHGKDDYRTIYDLQLSDCSITAHEELSDPTIDQIMFSPNGDLMATRNLDRVHFWSLPNNDLLRTIEETQDSTSSTKRSLIMAISPDWKILATAMRNQINLWNISDGSHIVSMDAREVGNSNGEDNIVSLAFSPDGTVLASGSEGSQISLWSVPTGNLLNKIDAGKLIGRSESIHNLVFSADGTLLSSISSKIIVLKVSDGSMLYDLGEKAFQGSQMAFSPDGSIIATTYENDVNLWRTSDGKLLRTLKGNSATKDLLFSPDGKNLVTKLDEGTIIFWGIVP